MNQQNVVLTGVARSGTTLLCFLLNQLPDVVALHEPIRFKKMVKLGPPEAVVKGVEQFYDSMRQSILQYGVAISKNRNGRVPDNPFGHGKKKNGVRVDDQMKGKITIDKKVSKDFLLGIKHPGPFTALLKWLHPRFSCYATIRNPLSILASWNSVEIPEREGIPPYAVRKMDPDLIQRLQRLDDRFERQLHLLDWYFSRYRDHLPEERIIRYEDIIHTQGRCLAVIVPEAAALQWPLESKNKSSEYDPELMQRLGEALLSSSGAYWDFYEKNQVEAILEA